MTILSSIQQPTRFLLFLPLLPNHHHSKPLARSYLDHTSTPASKPRIKMAFLSPESASPRTRMIRVTLYYMLLLLLIGEGGVLVRDSYQLINASALFQPVATELYFCLVASFVIVTGMIARPWIKDLLHVFTTPAFARDVCRGFWLY